MVAIMRILSASCVALFGAGCLSNGEESLGERFERSATNGGEVVCKTAVPEYARLERWRTEYASLPSANPGSAVGADNPQSALVTFYEAERVANSISGYLGSANNPGLVQHYDELKTKFDVAKGIFIQLADGKSTKTIQCVTSKNENVACDELVPAYEVSIEALADQTKTAQKAYIDSGAGGAGNALIAVKAVGEAYDLLTGGYGKLTDACLKEYIKGMSEQKSTVEGMTVPALLN